MISFLCVYVLRWQRRRRAAILFHLKQSDKLRGNTLVIAMTVDAPGQTDDRPAVVYQIVANLLDDTRNKNSQMFQI